MELGSKLGLALGMEDVEGNSLGVVVGFAEGVELGIAVGVDVVGELLGSATLNVLVISS